MGSSQSSGKKVDPTTVKKKSKEEKDKEAAELKEKELEVLQAQAVLDSDEVIACFDDTDDQDVGFKFIYEREPDIVKDIRLTTNFFNIIEDSINKQVVFPLTLEELKAVFEREYERLKTEINLFFVTKQNIEFVDKELKTFTEAEVYYPLLSKNKHEFMKLFLKQIKNFVTNVKLTKRLDYKNCKEYFLENYRKFGMQQLFEKFASEIKKHSSNNKYWLSEVLHANDHVLEAYNIFDHNFNVTLKLILIYFEKLNIQFQLLTKSENQINYNIVINNYLYWSITCLEKANFPVYKLYLSELARINQQINLKIGKSQLIALIFKYRGESFHFFKELRLIRQEIENKIFRPIKPAQGKDGADEGSGTVLYKPLTEKFSHNFKFLIRDTLPSIYDKFDKFKAEIESTIKGYFSNFFSSAVAPFNIKILESFLKKTEKRNFSEFVTKMFKLLLYTQADTYDKKFNLDPEDYQKRTERVFEFMSFNMNELQKEQMRALKDNILTKLSYSQVVALLSEEATKTIEEYNTVKVNREHHLYVLFSLFIVLSGIALRREGGRMVFKLNEYLSCSRYIIFRLVNKLRNFDFAINNWTVINLMEFKVEDYLEDYQRSGSSKIKPVTEDSLLVKLRTGKIREVVEYMRSQKTRLVAYLKFSMDQHFNQEDHPDFNLEKVFHELGSKEYFFSFKPLFARETGTNSRHILIFISSFLNQAEDQEALWKEYIEGEPYTECYSFQWPTMDIFGYNEIKIQMEQEYTDNNTKSDLFHFGVNLLSKNHIKAVKLQKLDMNPFYNNLYYMAQVSGKALAFFIGQLRMFGASTVTLIGYSMGSVVGYNCLQDLYFMKKSNLIYNYVSIGSPLSRKLLDPEIVKLVVGTFFNIYSMDDKVMKYLSTMVPNFANPCGLNEIVYDGALYSSKQILVYNYDMTAMVHCHMDYTKHFKKIVEFVKRSDNYKSLSDFIFK